MNMGTHSKVRANQNKCLYRNIADVLNDAFYSKQNQTIQRAKKNEKNQKCFFKKVLISMS